MPKQRLDIGKPDQVALLPGTPPRAEVAQKAKAVISKLKQLNKDESLIQESNLYWEELSKLVQSCDLHGYIEEPLLALINYWEWSDDNEETKLILTILVILKELELSDAYINKVLKYIKKCDLSYLIFTEDALMREFVNHVVDIEALHQKNNIYLYAMHLKVKIKDPHFTRLRVLKEYLDDFVDPSNIIDCHVGDNSYTNFLHHNNSPLTELQLGFCAKELERQLFPTAVCFISNEQDLGKLDKAYISLLITLASSDHKYLSWGAICVLYTLGTTHNLTYLLQLIFPTLISMIVEPFEDSKTLEEYTRTHHIPLDLLPISMLTEIITRNTSFVIQLDDIQMVQKIEKWYDSFNLGKGYISRFDSMCFSKYFIILSHLATYDDKTKLAIAKSKMNELLKLTLTKHLDILRLWNRGNVGTIYKKALSISNNAVVSVCVLLRSLSRSASLLRMFFVHNKYIELFINLLLFETDALKEDNQTGGYFYEKENELQTLILGTLANLIIDFSASRDEFNVHDIMKVAGRYMDNTEYIDRCSSALSFIRNGLFGNDVKFREEFQDVIGLGKIFRLCDDEKLNIQIQSFNIIRNLLTTKNPDFDYMYNEFENYQAGSKVDFVEFLRIHLCKSQNLVLTTTLCYTLVHFSSLSVENKVMLIKNDALMMNLIGILQMKQKSEDIQESFWEIKTCIAWIIINLTTSDPDDVNFSMDRIRTVQDHKLLHLNERSKRLIELGFHETFKILSNDCPSVDFIERASRAVFQLLVSSNSN